jgi:hypothetical protein
MLAVLLFLAVPVSAAVSPGTVALGDTLTVSGEAPGAKQVAIYIFGPNYFHYATVSVDGRHYSYQLQIPDTLSASQYYCVVQSPGTGSSFSVMPVTVDGTTYITTASSESRFAVTGPGALQSSQAAYALEQMIDSPDIPDLCQTFTFQVVLPRAGIDPIGTRQAGVPFTISGTTNLAAGDQLLVEIRSPEFWPAGKNAGLSRELAAGDSGTATVRAGPGDYNIWSFAVSPLREGSYQAVVSGVAGSVSAAQDFPVVTEVPAAETIALPTVTASDTAVPVPAPTVSPGFGVPAALGAFLFFRRR